MTNKFNPENEPNEWLREEVAGELAEKKMELWSALQVFRNNAEQINTLTSMLVFGISVGYIRL